MKLSGWGNFPRADVRLLQARGRDQAVEIMRSAGALIARGNGRAYGDAALNLAATLSMLPSNRFLSFDAVTGRLNCEAGVLLSDLLSVFVPRGWFVPVTPGTKFVTVAGMVASDVHGKNHHGAGSFGDHVVAIELLLPSGDIVKCGPSENAELFDATRGGMGLTGVILTVQFSLLRIETPYIRQETLRAKNLGEAMEIFEHSNGWTYSVAWIDCLARGKALGRSLIYRGEHARPDELPLGLDPTLREIKKRPKRVGFDLPAFALNRWSVSAFNAVYFRRSRPGCQFVDYDSYFYPLDALLDWNRIYGASGFVQYQCVLPKDASQPGLSALLDRIARAGTGSFLAVLKLFGPQRGGMLSFPMEGYTLALDFAVSAKVLSLMVELDAIVTEYGGRLYLAKDARGPAALMQKGYPRQQDFKSMKSQIDPENKLSSVQSQRLGL